MNREEVRAFIVVQKINKKKRGKIPRLPRDISVVLRIIV